MHTRELIAVGVTESVGGTGVLVGAGVGVGVRDGVGEDEEDAPVPLAVAVTVALPPAEECDEALDDAFDDVLAFDDANGARTIESGSR